MGASDRPLCARARRGEWALAAVTERPPPPPPQPSGVERRQLRALVTQKGGRPFLALRADSAEDSPGSEVRAPASSEAALKAGEAGRSQSLTGDYVTDRRK